MNILCARTLRFVLLWPLISISSPRSVHVTFDWTKIERISQSTPTLQVVVNPLLRRESPIHAQVYENLKNLKAEHVRFVPWMPYPRLGVAQLEAPQPTRTFWDFSLIDPLVEDFFGAMEKRPVVMNFSTIPQWMFQTDWDVWYPDDPNEAIWGYQQGTELRDPTMTELAGYYKRLAQWYMKGGFVDEAGMWRESKHQFKIKTWEVFNEIDVEHFMTPQQYTDRYDAIVKAVRQVEPSLEFMGLALMRPMELPHYFEYFLNPANHDFGIPVDWIAYHFYATAQVNESLDSAEMTFERECERFLRSARDIDGQRQRLSPHTRTAINEIGTMRAEDYSDLGEGVDGNIPGDYWKLSAVTFAYLFGELSKLGTELITQSQIVGFPGQFPSVTMLHWETGIPNARYWMLKLLIENFSAGDRIVQSKSSEAGLYSFAVLKKNGSKKILFANRRGSSAHISFNNLLEGWTEKIDNGHSQTAPAREYFIGQHLELGPYGFAIFSEFETGSKKKSL